MLRFATVAYAVALVAHTLDHLRRGIGGLRPDVLVAGDAGTLGALAVIGLVFARHRLAAPVATAVGFANALGVAAVHALPPWGALSDSFWLANVDALSRGVVGFEIAASLALGVAGAAALRSARATPSRSA